MKFDYLLRYGLILSFFVLIAMSSCISHRQLVMLNEGPEYINDSIAAFLNRPPIIVQSDDRIIVKVNAFDDEVAEPFNMKMDFFGGGQGGGQQMMGGGGMGGGAMQNMMGALVDSKGNVELPVIGTVNVGGMTLEEVKQKLYGIYNEYLINFSVDVIFLNKRVTVTGEVATPRIVSMDRNRMSILEVIQQSGGITPFSNTEQVVVIRELGNGNRSFGTISLKDRNIVNSDYFYVYPNDIIYVQPIRAKTFTTQTSFLTGMNIVTSLVSAAALIIAFSR